jgi:hypothetical protein
MSGFAFKHDPEKLRAGMPAPTFEGEHGRAWRIADHDPEPNESTIATWLIEAPYAHPVWHSYIISLAHLRQRGMPGPIKYRDGASHEMILMALAPEGDRANLIKVGSFQSDTCTPLMPLNFACQFANVSDDEARQTVEDVVHDVCDAKISPDTDFLRMWVKRFGGHMLKTEGMTQ